MVLFRLRKTASLVSTHSTKESFEGALKYSAPSVLTVFEISIAINPRGFAEVC